MAIQDKEYLFTINDFNEPKVVNGSEAVGLRLTNLLLMNPGSDPLHPEMGVGLKNYRYGLSVLDQLRDRISDQIKTYLPMYTAVDVQIIRTPDKVCNIEITVDGVTYVYDSKSAPIPIGLEEIVNS
jgi:hypothetical protein